MVHYKPTQLFRHQEQFLSLGDWQDLQKCPKIVNKLFILKLARCSPILGLFFQAKHLFPLPGLGMVLEQQWLGFGKVRPPRRFPESKLHFKGCTLIHLGSHRPRASTYKKRKKYIFLCAHFQCAPLLQRKNCV